MTNKSGSLCEPLLDFDTWRDLLSQQEILYTSERDTPQSFAGSIRAGQLYGFNATDLSTNAYSVDRTRQHTRLDGADHFKIFLQASGKSTLIQNDRATEVSVGDVGLLDLTQPFRIVRNSPPVRALCVYLPRRSLTSYLRVEPNGGVCWPGNARATRLLFRLVLDAIDNAEPSSVRAEAYMQLAIFDLPGALFEASNPPPHFAYGQVIHARLQHHPRPLPKSRLPPPRCSC